MNTEQKLRVNLLLGAILETIRESGPQGAPAGPMYAALMGHLTLEQFETIMKVLTASGKVRKQGHVYFCAEKVS